MGHLTVKSTMTQVVSHTALLDVITSVVFLYASIGSTLWLHILVPSIDTKVCMVYFVSLALLYCTVLYSE